MYERLRGAHAAGLRKFPVLGQRQLLLSGTQQLSCALLELLKIPLSLERLTLTVEFQLGLGLPVSGLLFDFSRMAEDISVIESQETMSFSIHAAIVMGFRRIA